MAGFYRAVGVGVEEVGDLVLQAKASRDQAEEFKNSALTAGRTRTFNTFAEMVASQELKVGDVAITLGFRWPGDGGGNEFEIVATSNGDIALIDLGGLWARPLWPGGVIHLKQCGFTGVGDEGAVFAMAYGIADSLGLPLDLGSGTLLTDGGHTWPAGLIVRAGEFIIKRYSSGYTGTDPVLIIGDDVQTSGHLIFDGNNPDETGTFDDSFATLLIPGDNVSMGRLTCINSPMPSGGEKQLIGCRVSGDNFYCSRFIGRNCGYSALRLHIAKDMKRFKVDSFESYDSDFKGFSIGNQGTSTIKLIDLGSVEIDFDPVYDGSDGFLCDLENDNSFLGVETLSINKLKIRGGRSNCLKVQNVKSFECNYAELDVTTTYESGNAGTIETGICNIGTLIFNRRSLRVRSLNSQVESIISRHEGDAGDVPNLIRYEGINVTLPNVSLSGPRKHYVGELKLLGEPSIDVLVALVMEIEDEHQIHIESVQGAHVPVFGDYDAAYNGQNYRQDGAISVSRVIGSDNRLNLNEESEAFVQVGQRQFQTRSGAPTKGVWRVGDYVRNVATTTVDPDGANYINKGFLCTEVSDDGVFKFKADRIYL